MHVDTRFFASASFLVLLLISFPESGQSGENLSSVGLTTVERADITEIVMASGLLKSKLSVDIVSPGVGYIEKVLVKDGDPVTKGTLIFEIEASELASRLRATLSNLQLAQLELKRNQELFADNVVSRAELDRARTSLVNAQSNYAVIKTELDRYSVKAPLDGVIEHFDIEIGQYFSAGKKLATIHNDAILNVEFYLPERFYSRLREGQRFTFQSDAVSGNTGRGSVDVIGTKADRRHSIFLKGEIDNSDNRFLPDSFANITLEIGHRKNVIVIPEDALLTTLGGKSVFKVKNGKVSRESIKTGITNRGMVEVTQGLDEGDEIVLTGQFKLKDGQSIKAKAGAKK